ncbi:succinate--CoA ligase subunit alpha [Candidatus Marsarchaeota G2 archaeon ECH_B_SAG-F08]|uniref:Succinate--CoA ligase [ADP-forming] subunit alpha n=7 Tax=Candidatus Marsarchaeota TaxID=1978152 RepID=A0A2R6BYK7_9ARCH|nr:MAG: succinate--CoA ligase subunit alpha [Candidatus Marsarchaeota G1 archaeon OSP_D]PSN86812.1 MAG: succinate--CoA ligase subunit alpha [Candidatus Marsarchaeota G1 archaeon BE_D]PSN89730.1 MAG: succinate--CoA ligase subunit alpha [Candidatus Marsarchaeota G1 archaeon OSP_C]PSN95469.1 MAG: succinate--CoA ligase subunit alpha [Candidatus Marsarchaeota G1 archaeon OSP_B]PSN98123.1 MAG: succinate--CoA ligase subunit alpha [Candidatus Marsarchaeota G2 archaeon ECH_B_SAG-F08]PSO03728.1 MAG: suc
MVILVNSQTKVVVQGITGKEGSFHTKQMLEYGTNVVAGVTPGKGGTKFLDSIPVYDTVKQAVSEKDANTSIIFVPAPFAKDAMLESINAGLKLVITITEHIPPLDTWKAVSHAKRKGVTLIGPNCPGVISPGLAKVGIMPARVFIKGNVGVVSRSGTLTYEVAYRLTQSGIGQSTVVGIGGDPIVGTTFTQILELFERDQDTKAVVMIGEIGGDAEERAAEYIGANMSKPVVAYIAGVTAPQGKRMGHAGAIISGTEGTAQAKIDALKSVGVKVASVPNEIPKLVKEALSR